jgi:hypothetical protein
VNYKQVILPILKVFVEYFFLEELGQAQTLQNANGGKKTRE